MARIAAIGLLMAGCTWAVPGGWVGTGHPELHVNEDVPELFYDALVIAAGEYCERGLGCVDIKAGHGFNEVRMGEPDTRYSAQVKRKGLKRVMYLHRPSAVQSEPCALALARHELGHFLGYKHSADPNDLMYPLVSCNLKTKFPQN